MAISKKMLNICHIKLNMVIPNAIGKSKYFCSPANK